MCVDWDRIVSKLTSKMWTIQKVEIFDEDFNKGCFEDGTKPVFKRTGTQFVKGPIIIH